MDNSYDSMQQNREAFIQDILDQLEKDSLKKEIIRRQSAPPKSYFILEALKHPAFLLVLGFALTGFVGNWLTSIWQSREWERQQQRQVQLKGIDTKYALINELTKFVEEYNVAVEDVYSSCCIGMPETDEESYKETITKLEAWGKSINSWNGYSPILERKLTVYFRDPAIVNLFKEVNVIEAHLEEIYRRLRRLYKNPNENKDKINDLRNLLSERHKDFSSNLRLQVRKSADLVQLMSKEIQADIKGTV